MVLDAPYVYIFNVLDKYYLYDVNKNTILKINKSTADLVESVINNKDNEIYYYNNDIISQMIENGFLSSNRVLQLEHGATETIEHIIKNNLCRIVLQITQNCNLRCKYCVYSGNYYNRTHSNKRMSFEMAKRCIDFLIAHSRESQDISISFYGGEPLLEFDLIKKCVQYAEENLEGKNLHFNMTTNGTLLNDEQVKFFLEHNVHLVISLDGPKDVHDENRVFASNGKGTFDTIIKNLEKIKTSYPEFLNKIRFNIVLDPTKNFGCVDEFFVNYDTVKEIPFNLSLISSKYSKTERPLGEQYRIEFEYEKFKLFLSKINKLNHIYVSKLIKKSFETLERLHESLIPYEKLNIKSHHPGPCVPGVFKLFVDVNGTFYPCERVSENSIATRIGNINDGFDVDKIKEILNLGKINEDDCKNCWAFRLCRICVVRADGMTHLSKEVKAKSCIEEKKLITDRLKDYCTLREFGYDFSEQII